MNLAADTVLVRGQRVRVLRGGSGPPLLVLHGWGSHAEKYRRTFTHLASTSATVAIPDLPGFGGSPVPSSEWGTPEYAAWVADLAAALGWSSYTLLGHSFGGGIALALAFRCPQQIRHLVLYATRGVTPRPKRRIALFRHLATWGKRLFSVVGLRSFEPLARRVLYRAAGARDYARGGPLQPVMQKVVAEDLRPLLPRIAAPTTIIWGAEDRVTPLSDTETLRRGIPQARVKVVRQAGHAIHLEHPEAFARVLRDALEAAA